MFIGCNCREELSLNELQSSGYELPRYPTPPPGGGLFFFLFLLFPIEKVGIPTEASEVEKIGRKKKKMDPVTITHIFYNTRMGWVIL